MFHPWGHSITPGSPKIVFKNVDPGHILYSFTSFRFAQQGVTKKVKESKEKQNNIKYHYNGMTSDPDGKKYGGIKGK